MATYGLNHDRPGYKYRGVGRRARIERPGEKKYRDVSPGKGLVAGAAAGAVAGGIIGQTRNRSKDPDAVRKYDAAEKKVRVKSQNVRRHIAKGKAKYRVGPLKMMPNKAQKNLSASLEKLKSAKSEQGVARAGMSLKKHPMLKSVGKGTAIGAGVGLLGSLLMEKRYALEDIFEFTYAPGGWGGNDDFAKEYWDRQEKSKTTAHKPTKPDDYQSRPPKGAAAKPAPTSPAAAPPKPSEAQKPAVDAIKKKKLPIGKIAGGVAGGAVLAGAFYAMKKKKEKEKAQQQGKR
jgi:hypothetical protein